MDTYELYYSSGGHGGPYRFLEAVLKAARILNGLNPPDPHATIRIVNRISGATVDTITMDDAKEIDAVVLNR